MDAAKAIKSKQTIFLPAPPSAIERSSISNSAFVVGTYSLDTTEDSSSSTSASRSGSLCVVAPASSESPEYAIIHSYSTTSAVLDISIDHWHKSIAVANSTGGIEVWKETPSADNPSIPVLTHGKTVQAFPSDILVLSLDQNPSSNQSSIFAVSLSDGSLAVVDLIKESPVIWQADGHDLEAWTVRWFPSMSTARSTAGHSDFIWSDILYSGGDDSALRATQVSTDILPWNPPMPEGATEITDNEVPKYDNTALISAPYVNKRIHSAGVTAILPLADTSVTELCLEYSSYFLTGSYDDKIRVLETDKAFPTRFRCLSELNLGGGVWRLSLIGRQRPDQSENGEASHWFVLASCMYAGCRVLEISFGPQPGEGDAGNVWKIRVLATFEEHESMNYASAAVGNVVVADAERHTLEGVEIVSTSFYDRRFCVWELNGLAEDEKGNAGLSRRVDDGDTDSKEQAHG